MTSENCTSVHESNPQNIKDQNSSEQLEGICNIYSIYIEKSNIYCKIVEHWFFEIITDNSIQGNEQEEGEIEGQALDDNRSEKDSDCPEITNCSGKLSPIFIIMCTLFILQD